MYLPYKTTRQNQCIWLEIFVKITANSLVRSKWEIIVKKWEVSGKQMGCECETNGKWMGNKWETNGKQMGSFQWILFYGKGSSNPRDLEETFSSSLVSTWGMNTMKQQPRTKNLEQKNTLQYKELYFWIKYFLQFQWSSREQRKSTFTLCLKVSCTVTIIVCNMYLSNDYVVQEEYLQ